MKLKPILIPLILGCGSLISYSQLTEVNTFNPNLAIPDGNSTGVSDSQLITGSGISAIGSLTVDLKITGDFNGDLYVYLRHETETTPGNFVTDGYSVLLNRVGRTSVQPSGYDDSGFNVTLSDTAANGDVHGYHSGSIPASGSPLLGIWQPDGRNTNPNTVLDTDPRTASLSAFQNDPVNGRWTLFVADLQSGGVSQIDSWALNISTVPEPATAAAAAALGLFAFAAGRRLLKRTY